MNYFVDLLKRKWWYGFNEGLLGEVPIDRLQNKIVITLEAKHPKKNDKQYLYGYFDNPQQLYNYIQKIPLSNRHFYEKIIGRFPQKPHFDIDIDLVAHPEMDLYIFNELINELIQAIDAALIERRVQIDLYRDILLFTSHSENKLSCHLIIDHYCHSNHQEAYGFYQNVTKRMTDDYVKFIDSRVYRSTQDFRLMGSTKYGKERYKTFNKKWLFNDIEIEYVSDNDVDIFKSALVSWIEDCTLLPAYEPEEVEKVDKLYKNTFDYLANQAYKAKNNININYQYDTTPLTVEEVNRALVAVRKYYREELNMSFFPFKFSGFSGRIISFKRLKPSLCPICSQIRTHVDNVHTSITPFLIINKKGIIKYRCYQDQTKTFIIINVQPTIQPIQPTIQQSTPVNQVANINFSLYQPENNKSPIDTAMNNFDSIKSNKISNRRANQKNKAQSRPKKIINVEEKLKLMQLKNRYSNDIIALNKKM